MAFEVHGTEGALRWNFEQMNELEVYLPAEGGFPDGYTRVLSGPNHPPHSNFIRDCIHCAICTEGEVLSLIHI